jgi:hypothetical protein
MTSIGLSEAYRFGGLLAWSRGPMGKLFAPVGDRTGAEGIARR